MVISYSEPNASQKVDKMNHALEIFDRLLNAIRLLILIQ